MFIYFYVHLFFSGLFIFDDAHVFGVRCLFVPSPNHCDGPQLSWIHVLRNDLKTYRKSTNGKHARFPVDFPLRSWMVSTRQSAVKFLTNYLVHRRRNGKIPCLRPAAKCLYHCLLAHQSWLLCMCDSQKTQILSISIPNASQIHILQCNFFGSQSLMPRYRLSTGHVHRTCADSCLADGFEKRTRPKKSTGKDRKSMEKQLLWNRLLWTDWIQSVWCLQEGLSTTGKHINAMSFTICFSDNRVTPRSIIDHHQSMNDQPWTTYL